MMQAEFDTLVSKLKQEALHLAFALETCYPAGTPVPPPPIPRELPQDDVQVCIIVERINSILMCYDLLHVTRYPDQDPYYESLLEGLGQFHDPAKLRAIRAKAKRQPHPAPNGQGE